MAKKSTKKPEPKRSLTVSEAGQKGGKKTHALYGKEFYEGIGRKGGARVRELIAAGRAGEAKPETAPPKVAKKAARAIPETAIAQPVSAAKKVKR